MNMNNQIKYPVAEQFVSINGEGTKAGELAVFIRFKGCNLNCSYCDTQWANRQDTPAVEKTAAELVADVCRTGIDNVTMTGGEPLLQTELAGLIKELLSAGKAVVATDVDGIRELKCQSGKCACTGKTFNTRTAIYGAAFNDHGL